VKGSPTAFRRQRARLRRPLAGWRPAGACVGGRVDGESYRSSTSWGCEIHFLNNVTRFLP
jgi:hypothetical protein